jgi:hypothetical protein
MFEILSYCVALLSILVVAVVIITPTPQIEDQRIL